MTTKTSYVLGGTRGDMGCDEKFRLVQSGVPLWLDNSHPDDFKGEPGLQHVECNTFVVGGSGKSFFDYPRITEGHEDVITSMVNKNGEVYTVVKVDERAVLQFQMTLPNFFEIYDKDYHKELDEYRGYLKKREELRSEFLPKFGPMTKEDQEAHDLDEWKSNYGGPEYVEYTAWQAEQRAYDEEMDEKYEWIDRAWNMFYNDRTSLLIDYLSFYDRDFIESKNRMKYHPLQASIILGRVEMTYLLLRVQGPDLTMRTDIGDTLFMLAARLKDKAIYRMLACHLKLYNIDCEKWMEAGIHEDDLRYFKDVFTNPLITGRA